MTRQQVRFNIISPSRRHRLATAILVTFVLAYGAPAIAGDSGQVDSSNIGVATQDAVISSGLPDVNLDIRQFNEAISQQLMHTASPEYPTPAVGAEAHEHMIFKFDFSSLPAGAVATNPAFFDFSAWFTRGEGTEDETIYGRFKFFEITRGDSGWTDRIVSDGVENPNPVTWNNLNGTFVELNVGENSTGQPENKTGNPFGSLYPGLLVSNGGFDGANRVAGIPIETVNRLITGQSIGLAMGSVPPQPAALSGDCDRDADVDGQDLMIWQRQLGSTVDFGTGADGNGDGQINAPDLKVWSDNFGAASIAIEGTTNFSIHTTESFFSPASAPTLRFDWAVAMDSTVPLPEPSWTSLLYSIAAISRLGRLRRRSRCRA